FLIHQERGYMSDIHWDISPVIYILDISDIKGLMFYTLWDMIVLGCLPSNMQYRQDSTLPRLLKKILCVIVSSWIKSDFLLIGAGKSELQTRPISNGHNGFSLNYSIAGMTFKRIKQEI